MSNDGSYPTHHSQTLSKWLSLRLSYQLYHQHTLSYGRNIIHQTYISAMKKVLFIIPTSQLWEKYYSPTYISAMRNERGIIYHTYISPMEREVLFILPLSQLWKGYYSSVLYLTYERSIICYSYISAMRVILFIIPISQLWRERIVIHHNISAMRELLSIIPIKGVDKQTLHLNFCFAHISASLQRIFKIFVPTPYNIPLTLFSSGGGA